MTSPTEVPYEQCLDELRTLSASLHSLDEYAEKAVHLIREQLDFLFVGIALLNTSHSVRFYKGTEDRYRKKLSLSLENSNPISITIRQGRPLLMAVDDSENIFNDPDLPDEKLRFFLPLKSQEGVFGAMEVVSAFQLDKDNRINVVSNLEILSTEVASSCSKFMDKSTIGFWTESAR